MVFRIRSLKYALFSFRSLELTWILDPVKNVISSEKLSPCEKLIILELGCDQSNLFIYLLAVYLKYFYLSIDLLSIYLSIFLSFLS